MAFGTRPILREPLHRERRCWPSDRSQATALYVTLGPHPRPPQPGGPCRGRDPHAPPHNPPGLRATAAAARYREAISRARSHLDGISAKLVQGEQEGDDGGGYRWRVLTRPVGSTGTQDTAGSPVPATDSLVVTLYAITVWIVWREGIHARMVQLDSERLLLTAPDQERQR